MPQRRNAIKDLRVNKRRKLRNLKAKTELKKTLKKFKAPSEVKESEAIAADLSIVYKKIDKAVKRKILHKNTAARRKSLFSRIAKSKVSQ